MRVQAHNPANLPLIDYRDLRELQGSLKDLIQDRADKLLRLFEEFGFVFPFFVWFDQAKTPWIMDGHGRKRVMLLSNIQNENGGYLFPYVKIEADSRRQAKKLLLACTSQFQKVTQEGFDEFTFDLEETWLNDHIVFDALPLREEKEKPEKFQIKLDFKDREEMEAAKIQLLAMGYDCG